MSFEREIGGVRRIETNYGDTLKQIALRELGSATLWIEIAVLNGLKPPYIVTDPGLVEPGVILAGDALLVPSSQQSVDSQSDPDYVFFRDVSLRNGFIDISNGDIDIVGGIANFTQALRIRITTWKRELMFHPEFGCWLPTLLGGPNNSVAGGLAAFYVRSALLEDDRVESVLSCVAEISGDVIRVDATVKPISGRSVDISVTV